MQGYDAILKRLLTGGRSTVLGRLTGLTVTNCLTAELPEVRTRTADLFGRTADGGLVHVELQSRNDARMGIRMLGYAVSIHAKYRQFPQQMVLYVGRDPLRMNSGLHSHSLQFEFGIHDIRDLDSEELLASGELADSVVAVLGRIQDQRNALRRILSRIGAAGDRERRVAEAELMILAGLRDLRSILEAEQETMPITEDLRDHNILEPYFRESEARGLAQGIARGILEGTAQGEVLAERRLLTKLIVKRFGPASPDVVERLNTKTSPELEDLTLRLFDVSSIEELLR